MRPNHARSLDRAPSDESGISCALPRHAARSQERRAAPHPELGGEFWDSHAELTSRGRSGPATRAALSKTELEAEIAALQEHVNALSSELEHKRAELEALQALVPKLPERAPAARVQPEEASQPSGALALTGVSIRIDEAGDRRDAPRSKLALEVAFLGESALYSGLSEDLSTGGVFVATYQLLPVGTDVTLGLDLSNGAKLEVRGQVRWHRGSTEDAFRPGMGIAFTDPPASARATLQALCEHCCPLYVEV